MTTQCQSRLERMIARLMTQRALLDHFAMLITDIPGPVLEIGLGKGRTYSHLRNLLPDRTIWAFDFEVHAPKHSQPAPNRTVLGDFRDSLTTCWDSIANAPAMVHADIGTESRKAEQELVCFVGDVIASRLAPGGYLLGDRNMAADGLESVELPIVELPSGIDPWPYFCFRHAGG
ncbi:MAG: hypothetical protein OXD42_06060 [Rhodospirillaceae bacterium]|nr:hypothetical protein [Rhodospirillaceae bacterium]